MDAALINLRATEKLLSHALDMTHRESVLAGMIRQALSEARDTVREIERIDREA